MENTDGLLEIHQYDCNANPARLKCTWNETMWDTAVTAFAIYDNVPRIVLAEKQMKYVTSMGYALSQVSNRKSVEGSSAIKLYFAYRET